MGEPYRHVISLGFFCSVAMEIERYGFRDASYPLDWLICPIEPVLALLASEFEGFLRPESLQRDEASPRVVHDVEQGISFHHDFAPEQDVAEQVDRVKAKYARRIERLYRAARERTLFVRYIENAEEFAYLDARMAEVLAQLRRLHPANDLLLVGDTDLPRLCGGIEVFHVRRDRRDSVARVFVRKNLGLRLRLLGLPYPLRARLGNYLRYLGSERLRRRWMAPLRALKGPVGAVIGQERMGELVARLRGRRAA